MNPSRRWWLLAGRWLVVAALCSAVLPAGSEAQTADFKFGPPRLTVAVMAGVAVPGEASDLFEFTREELTVSRGDFRSAALAVEVAIRGSERLDVVLGLDYASSTVPSEMRAWVTQDDAPIPQVTEFGRGRLTAGVRGYLKRRGRSISRYAWVPGRWSPYLGAGGGWAWYEFDQHGDFVDFRTLDIFEDRFLATGGGAAAYLAAGVEVSLSAHLLVRGEYRRLWGRGALDSAAFVGFEDIDLSGSRVTLGLAARL